MSEMKQALADALQPASAPESLWYRVDAELARAPTPRRGMPRLALAFAVLLVAVVSVGWYLDKPAPAVQPAQIVRGEHACALCHV